MWLWFAELDKARTGNGFAANTLSHTEIDAWARLYGVRPKEWELRAIRALDLERCAHLNKDSGEAPEAPPVGETHALSADLFDALFA